MTAIQNTVSGRPRASDGREATVPLRRAQNETRRFIATSEFWMTLIAVGAVAVVYNVAADASLTLWRAALLASAIAISYIVSRGVAKAGSQRERWDDARSDS
jgi:hypothetical protein